MFEEFEKLCASGQLRELKTSRRAGKFIEINGMRYLDFGSNDYLGIAARKDLQTEFFDSLNCENEFIFGGTASRLLTGNHEDYEIAEVAIGAEYGRACLMFNSGYHANTGVIPVIAGKGDLILCDKLAHASIIDALKLGDAKWLRFAHNDVAHLRKLLLEHRANFKRVLIVTESLFSMDGDTAPLAELVQLKNEFDAILYLDEAHAFGVCGERGLGIAEEFGLMNEVDFIMCTLGKALAGEGAFVISSAQWRDMFVNKARSLIFTTSLPPINLKWTAFIFARILKMQSERAVLKKLSETFRRELADFSILGERHIAPLLVGESAKALEFSKALAAAGIWAPAVRPPTVPPNGARLRFSLSAAMSIEDAAFCSQKISEIK